MRLITIKLYFGLFLFLFLSTGIFAECQYKQLIVGEELSVGVMLSWSTSLEKENAMFIIERSNDGIFFTNLGAVKAAGHSTNKKEYSFLDNNRPNNQQYYRLRQIDFSGSFKTSPVFIFNKYPPRAFVISTISYSLVPNSLEIQFDAFEAGKFEYELMNQQGKSLLVNSVHAGKGFNSFTIDLGEFEDFIYHLTLKGTEQEQTIAFRKKVSMKISTVDHF